MAVDKRVGTRKFGWCLDGHHAECWQTNGDHECTCECHTTTGDTRD